MKEVNNMENKEINGRCVYVPALARQLLRKGHTIIDIKPNRECAERTVFVFSDNDTFNADLENALNEVREKKAKKSEQARLNAQVRDTCLELEGKDG